MRVIVRTPFAPENLLVLLERIKALMDNAGERPATAGQKVKVAAKTVEIHAPTRVVAFLSRLVQLDAAALQQAKPEDVGEIAGRLDRRLDWLARMISEVSDGAHADSPAFPARNLDVDSARMQARAMMADGAAGDLRDETELLELELGCLVAYLQLTPPRKQLDDFNDLAGVLPTVAIALATVAPIWKRGANASELEVLSTPDIQQRLFVAGRAGAHCASLDDLTIRRSDLRSAIAVLKEARMSFGTRR